MAGYCNRSKGKRRAYFDFRRVVGHAYPAKTAPVCIFYRRKKTAQAVGRLLMRDYSPEILQGCCEQQHYRKHRRCAERVQARRLSGAVGKG